MKPWGYPITIGNRPTFFPSGRVKVNDGSHRCSSCMNSDNDMPKCQAISITVEILQGRETASRSRARQRQRINRYINWAQSRYTNATFVQVPHYAVSSYIKYGFLGCKQNPKQRIVSLADITDFARRQYGIEWAFFGFKQTDSLNRRVMLRTYDMEAICEKTKKAYPLSTYKNADILAYIERNGLIKPERYGAHQSAGTAVNDIGYLLWLRDNFPNDLKKVIEPLTERLLFEHDYKTETE